MLQGIILKGELSLSALEDEIIERKIEAYESALTSLIPLKMLIYPYVKDFKRKLTKQKAILIKTVNKMVSHPDKKQIYIKKAVNQYFFEEPFHSLVLLYIPRIIIPMHIQRLLNRFEHRIKRFFQQRVKDYAAFLQHLKNFDINSDTPQRKVWQFIFPEEQKFTAYLRSLYENDVKTLKMFKESANWRNFYDLDILNSFSITFIPLNRLFSRIWKYIPQAMEEFIKTKVLDFYLIDTLTKHVYEILKENGYRSLIESVIPAPPETIMEIMHDPECIMRFNPQKNMLVEKISSNRERYTVNVNMIIFKLKISWELVYQFEDYIEEWWIEKSNYLKSMTGFCIYERTAENFCHYYSLTVNVEPNEKLAVLGDMVLPTLERITKENAQQLIENIKTHFNEHSSNNT